jgi:thiopeptide-type bacteriocin biosynthesis protein
MSFHLYHGGDLYGPDSDRLLLDGVQPLVEVLQARAWIDRYFFVRYADPASHVRLRVSLGSSAASTEVASIIRDWPFAVTGFDPHARDAIQEVPYVPELDRYGGVAGIAIAEDLFALSSRTALRLLQTTRERGRPALLGQSMLSSLILAYSLLEGWEEVRQFFTSEDIGPRMPGAAGQPPFGGGESEISPVLDTAVEALAAAMTAGRELGIPLLDDWRTGCHAINLRLLASDLAAAERSYGNQGPLLRSYLHMHHNRLGFGRNQEGALARTAATALTRRQLRKGHELGTTR